MKMGSKDELKGIDLKNRMCYYFADIIRVGDFDFNNISFDLKSYDKSYANV